MSSSISSQATSAFWAVNGLGCVVNVRQLLSFKSHFLFTFSTAVTKYIVLNAAYYFVTTLCLGL